MRMLGWIVRHLLMIILHLKDPGKHCGYNKQDEDAYLNSTTYDDDDDLSSQWFWQKIIIKNIVAPLWYNQPYIALLLGSEFNPHWVSYICDSVSKLVYWKINSLISGDPLTLRSAVISRATGKFLSLIHIPICFHVQNFLCPTSQQCGCIGGA